MNEGVLTALVITTLAGLATAIGGLLIFNKNFLKGSFLASSLGFSAGAMILLSFTEIFSKAQASLLVSFDDQAAYALTFVAFFGGILVMAIIDRLIPGEINPNEIEGNEGKGLLKKQLLRSSMFIAVAISIHNFPEGFATFVSTVSEPSLGITLAIAIAIHNIPEGIAIAAPLYAATKNKAKTMWLTAASGLAEPVGAIVGFTLLSSVLNDTVFGIVFGAIGGVMVFIAIDELLPAAKRYETNQHQTVYGLIAGMMVVSLSLVLFR